MLGKNSSHDCAVERSPSLGLKNPLHCLIPLYACLGPSARLAPEIPCSELNSQAHGKIN